MSGAMSFHTLVLTPEGRVWDADADAVVMSGTDGLFGVLSGHAPMVSALAPGVLEIRQGYDTSVFAIGDGIARIGRDSVTLMAEAAVRVSSREEAEERLEAYMRTIALPPPAVVEGT
jgi:F-type H+-transporting ATPase subunit epsilon